MILSSYVSHPLLNHLNTFEKQVFCVFIKVTNKNVLQDGVMQKEPIILYLYISSFNDGILMYSDYGLLSNNLTKKQMKLDYFSLFLIAQSMLVPN